MTDKILKNIILNRVQKTIHDRIRKSLIGGNQTNVETIREQIREQVQNIIQELNASSGGVIGGSEIEVEAPPKDTDAERMIRELLEEEYDPSVMKMSVKYKLPCALEYISMKIQLGTPEDD